MTSMPTRPGTGDMTLLPDGREVPARCELARIFSAVQAQHLANLRRLAGRQARGEYLDQVARSEGQASADALRAAYLADWDQRKATK